ncbi:MAG: ATP synthase F1 subunit epsilon [Bryobacteraceae bacterium]|jgi:ATP synthase, F1 epsilon subunit (delta in mitochondria)|nr:ATP synthase F1 subunit epsilon [Bryobacteraceae bacterium]
MPGTILLEVSTPERMMVQEEVTEVQVPGATGYLGILPGHSPLLSELGCGPMWYITTAGVKRYVSVCTGFIEVLPDRVRILADRSEYAEEIDIERARAALERAQRRLTNPSLGVDISRALFAASRAQARIDSATQARNA